MRGYEITIMQPDLLMHITYVIFVLAWITLTVFFARLVKSSKKLEEGTNELVKLMDEHNVDSSVNEFGRAVFLPDAFVTTVKELPKLLLSMTRSSKVGFILSLLASILGIIQVILVIC